MAQNYVSIKIILDKLMRNPLLSDLSLETVVDYTVDFFKIVGVPTMFIDKVIDVDVVDYKAELPCDVVDINQILYDNIAIRYAGDSFHTDYKNGRTEYLADHTYKVQGGYIFTSVQKDTIKVSYTAILTDNDGLPMVPDNSNFTRALTAYIKKEHFTILLDLGKIQQPIFFQAKQDYAWAVGSCMTEFNRLDLGKAESFFNSFRSLLLRSDNFRTGFNNYGLQG